MNGSFPQEYPGMSVFQGFRGHGAPQVPNFLSGGLISASGSSVVSTR
ncbi:hypothetical protein Acr_06g0006980 [Actinidia rufa]|uniref:Uncharacterized protein n=1 Tax=Actinidia rufa TaxID=165716 RepID=A0A7J0EQJ3_9ERIC|nr:hypothetical protein Acr_06g0006980 [Actinidia rufa]